MRFPGLLVIATFTAALAAVSVFSATDPLTHQGRLLDASDAPVSNGTYSLIFRLYDAPAGGSPLWIETRDVVTSSGLYSTELGTINSLSEVISSHTDSDLYLEIAVAGVTLTPRQRLGVVPTATVARGVRGSYYATLLGTGSHTLSSSSDGSGLSLSWDNESDGTPDGEGSFRLSPTTSAVAIKTKGTGAANNRAATTTYPDSAIQVVGSDLDGDGMLELEVASSTSSSGATHSLHKKGLNAVNVKLAVTGEVDDLEARHSVGRDHDDDGQSDREISSICGPTTAKHAINTKGTGAQGGRVASVSSSTDEFSAAHSCEIDDDGDGSPDSEISQLLTPTTSSMAIKTKGTGAAHNRTIGSTCDDSSAVHVLDIDDDGDGIAEARAVSAVSSVPAGGGAAAASYAATGRLSVDSDDDGVPEQEIEQLLSPVSSSMAIKTKGTGAAHGRSAITNSTDTSGASSVLSVDLDDDGVADRRISEDCDDDDASVSVQSGSTEVAIRHKGWDGTIKGRMHISNGPDLRVDFDSDGDGYVASRFGIGVLDPANPLEHSSGAHLTAGGVWTNASDENLKENFQAVNGEELLEKIEQLPISEWNYKAESNEVKHIGPTAQDFQAAFGVGSDGKSISTIDPSGIALAAIKELNKQNRELKDQNNALQGQLEDLRKAVEALQTHK